MAIFLDLLHPWWRNIRQWWFRRNVKNLFGDILFSFCYCGVGNSSLEPEDVELICCPVAQRRPSRACTISCNLCQSVCRLKSQHNKYSYVHVALLFRRSTKLTFRVQSANEAPSSSVWSSTEASRRQRWGFRQSYHGFVVNFQARVCVLGEKPSGLLLLLRGELLQRAIHSPS